MSQSQLSLKNFQVSAQLGLTQKYQVLARLSLKNANLDYINGEFQFSRTAEWNACEPIIVEVLD
jgi:hypothetical protein